MKSFVAKLTRRVGMAPGFPAAIAIACLVAMIGCGEPIGPRVIYLPKPEQPEPAFRGLAVLDPELHDAADAFAQGVGNTALRSKVELAVKRLSDALLAEKVASSRAAIAEARSLLANVDDISAIELAPVGLALDHIERRINQILNLAITGG